MRALPTIAAITLLAACTDPSFDVKITYRQPIGDAATTPRIQVSVIDAEAAAEEPDDDIAEADCDDVAFGYIDPAVIDGARRASASGVDGASISGVPRLGAKLVIVEATNTGGRRLGAGCTKIGDVTSDETVDVEVVVAPTVLVFARQDTTDVVPVNLLAVAPWDPTLRIGGNRVITELHTTGASYDDELDDARFTDAGLHATPVLPPDGAPVPEGPAQTLVRVEWADVIRLPAFVPWKSIQTTAPAMPRITVGPDATAGFDRAWTLPRQNAAQSGFRLIAAGVEQPTLDGERIVVVRYDIAARGLDKVEVAAPGVRSVAFQDGLFTVLDNGWRRVNVVGAVLAPVPGVAEGSGAASQVHAVPDCDGDGAGGGPQVGGLLVRRTIGSALAYRAYLRPGVPVDPVDPALGASLHALAVALDAAGEVAVASDCLTIDDGSEFGSDVQVVLSRGAGLGVRGRIVESGAAVLMPDILAAATFTQQVASSPPVYRQRAVGVEASINGPKVSSYRFAVLQMPNGDPLTGFAADQKIQSQLATAPTSIDIFDFDGDYEPDVVAAIPTPLGSRLQVNLGRQVNREALAGVSATLPGGRGAGTAIVRLLEVDDAAMGRRELVVLTDEGVDVFCLDTEMPTDGARCAALPD